MEGQENPACHENTGEDAQEDGGEDVWTAATGGLLLLVLELILACAPATAAARLHHGIARLIRQVRTRDTLGEK